MKFRPKTPPEAIPFQRGKRSARSAPVERKPLSIEWISPAVWSALAAEGTDAHRLASGPEIWLERFGRDVLLSHQTGRGPDAVLAGLDQRCAGYSYRPLRVFGKYLPHHASERGAPVLLRGDAGGSLETEAGEAGVRYGLDFAGGYSAGLFIDQRANRARLRALKPKRLLNTFAYTCSFSVVAALGGAGTVSVDLSRRSLARGEGNFQRNGLDPKSGAIALSPTMSSPSCRDWRGAGRSSTRSSSIRPPSRATRRARRSRSSAISTVWSRWRWRWPRRTRKSCFQSITPPCVSPTWSGPRAPP